MSRRLFHKIMTTISFTFERPNLVLCSFWQILQPVPNWGARESQTDMHSQFDHLSDGKANAGLLHYFLEVARKMGKKGLFSHFGQLLQCKMFQEVFRVCHRKAYVQGFLKMW